MRARPKSATTEAPDAVTGIEKTSGRLANRSEPAPTVESRVTCTRKKLEIKEICARWKDKDRSEKFGD